MAREQGKAVFILADLDISNQPDKEILDQGEKLAILPDFLKDTQIIRLADFHDKQAVRQRLLQGLEKEGIDDEFPLPSRPYPGLEPFQERDAAIFFGRDREVTLILDKLNRCRRHTSKTLLAPSWRLWLWQIFADKSPAFCRV